jgi:hypothetical protein
MKYLVVGNGFMHLTEVPDVLADLKDPEELMYVATKQSKINIGETLVASKVFKTVVVAVTDPADADDLPPRLKGADDIILWDAKHDLKGEIELLALVPSDDETVDEFLDSTVEKALSLGIRCRAMNQQMHDLTIVDPEPEAPAESSKAEEAATGTGPAEPVEIPSAAELDAMTRADLKTLAKAVEARPADWRSKKGIIEAILAKQVDDDAGEDPYEREEKPGIIFSPPAKVEVSEDEEEIPNLELIEAAVEELLSAGAETPDTTATAVIETSRTAESETLDLSYVLDSLSYNGEPSDAALARINALIDLYTDVAEAIFDIVPPSFERTLAVRDLENSAMWAVKVTAVGDDLD